MPDPTEQAGQPAQTAEIKTIGEFEYSTKRLLGKGAWGEVYRGKQKSLNREVAIKILKKELSADPEFVKRFKREATTLATMTDEHIIQVYSVGEKDGEYFFIMEFVQGQPLSKFVERGRKFAVNEIVYVADSVARALRAAWESPAKIVHRDIKPANIMVSYSSSMMKPPTDSQPGGSVSESMAVMDVNIMETKVKVMDFGLAKLNENVDGEATMAGTVIGTPKYISPEQGMGSAADIRSDIYSLGIVMYEMATGRIPFESDSAMSMIRHHIYDTAANVSQFAQDFPRELEAIIMKCIQKDPNARYLSPAQLIEDLEAFRAQQAPIHASTSALDATMVSDFAKRQKKSSRMLYIGFGIAAVLMIGIGVFAYSVLFKPQGKDGRAAAGSSLNDATKNALVQIDGLIKQSRFTETWTALTKIDPKYQEHDDVSDRRSSMITKWADKIEGMVEKGDKLNFVWREYNLVPSALLERKESAPLQGLKDAFIKKWLAKINALLLKDLDAAWEEFGTIESTLVQSNNDLKKLQDTLTERWNKKIMSLVAAKMLEESPLVFTGTKLSNLQNSFNDIMKFDSKNQYDKLYPKLDSDFINIKTEEYELVPSAMYFKVKVMAREKASGYLGKIETMVSDLKELKDEHPDAVTATELAATLFDDLQMAYQVDRYKSYETGLEGKKLNEQLEFSKQFKSECDKDKYLKVLGDKVVAKIRDIECGLFKEDYTAYQDSVAKLDESVGNVKTPEEYIDLVGELKQSRNHIISLKGNLAKVELDEEEKAQYTDKLTGNGKTLDELETKIEMDFFALCGITPDSINGKTDGVYRLIKSNNDNAEMVIVPGGQFSIGTDDGEPFEKPVQSTIDVKEFYIDKYEITNAQFEIFVKSNKNYKTEAEISGKSWVWKDCELMEVRGANWRDPEGDGKGIKDRMDHPVVHVSWKDANEYAKWAGKRLLTEAEWEKAARGTKEFIYPWGNNWDENACNNALTGSGGSVPSADNKYESGKSPYGCFQMIGNVAEWCEDIYEDSYNYNKEMSRKKGSGHTLRGGSWILFPKFLRNTYRQQGTCGGVTGNFCSNYIGFRCAKDVDRRLATALGNK
ncbi:MAG: SUMF1/EgtB/PvdO family nonheme iron enzyme [Planctomycetes bacterium]|nr:SUMF1/EgtB/PvdO family nonheme iron enzyme [Planctomycetota bacterium]